MADYRATSTEFTAVADAIRTKGGTSAQLTWPNGFVSAVQAIPTGSGVVQPLSVTQNGTYTAPPGVDGYSPVTVNVSGGGGGISIQQRDFAKFNGVSGGIQLPFYLDENTGIEVKFQFLNVGGVDQNSIGTWDTAISGNITWIRVLLEGSYFYIGNGTQSGQNALNMGNTVYDPHVLGTNVNGYSVLDNLNSVPYVPTNPGRLIPLVIGDNYMTTQRNFFQGKIFYYKLYNRSTGIQIANIYPVTVTASDGAFTFDSLYDSINNKHYIGSNIFNCYDE